MGEDRANIFAEDDLAEFKPAPAKRQSPAVTKQAAASAGFVSRESKVVPIAQPVTQPARRTRRQHRTGRDTQFNMKARPETIAEFVAIADAQGWVFGEALEKAVDLLRAKYVAK